MNENKAIFNSYLAKQLIAMGNNVVDIQPDKKNKNGIIFYFKNNEKLNHDISYCLHLITKNTTKGHGNNYVDK